LRDLQDQYPGLQGQRHNGVDRPFNHATKVGTLGSVKERTGDYDDALRNKKALVIPMILEAYGISPHSLHFIRRLALRAKGARARDSSITRQHRLRRFEHERQVVLGTPHAAARSGCAGGQREEDPRSPR
jgi:hypothetical protein